MFDFQYLPVLLIVLILVLAWMWSKQIGWLRGSIAACLRAAWILPIVLAIYPITRSRQLPKALSVRPIHVLVDDSASMASPKNTDSLVGNTPNLTYAQGLLRRMDEYCMRSGCVVRRTLLSSLAPETKAGYTPLGTVLDGWLMALGADPWLILTDGGDWQPSLPWDESLRDAAVVAGNNTRKRGAVIVFGEGQGPNIWIDRVGAASFAFAGRTSQLDVEVHRDSPIDKAERVQVQILNLDQPLASTNIQFAAGDSSAVVSVPIPALARGQHLLEVRVLPTAGEVATWDNKVYVKTEVLPNTVGVLHLLGAPSWDGRFVRRFLKSEPKFDVISFFILRDPMDSQQLNERELSLIPFPVDRLFREELNNFRVVVMQNFALYQFLERPEYRSNLVKFVRDGGGLLFIGGPRALQTPDLDSSMLGSILPFTAHDSNGGSGGGAGRTRFGRELGIPMTDKTGPYFDDDLQFNIKLAMPGTDSRALANVYDDFEGMNQDFQDVGTLSGLHHTENVKFKPNEFTPLLVAKTRTGQELPLVIASYPGKGRAIWVLTDNMWRLAMAADRQVPRQAYQKFLENTFNWLLRQELKKPLIARNLTLRAAKDKGTFWNVRLRGPAARYFSTDGKWTIQVCGQAIALNDLAIEKYGSEEITLSGRTSSNLLQGERCRFALQGEHPAFGAVKTELTAVLPQTYSDAEIGVAPHKAMQLATLTGALALPYDDQIGSKVESWLDEWVQREDIVSSEQFETEHDYYWPLSKWWFLVILICVPMEVTVRRWRQLFG